MTSANERIHLFVAAAQQPPTPRDDARIRSRSRPTAPPIRHARQLSGTVLLTSAGKLSSIPRGTCLRTSGVNLLNSRTRKQHVLRGGLVRAYQENTETRHRQATFQTVYVAYGLREGGGCECCHVHLGLNATNPLDKPMQYHLGVFNSDTIRYT
jgi:hypothetical protein